MTNHDFAASVDAAVAVLQSAGVIALPTDTLYALVADAGQDEAVQRVFAIKGRDAVKALPLFVDGLEMALQIADLNDQARRLAAAFWPGALTIVANKRPDFASVALGGGETIALRAPDSELALDVARRLGRPVTGTSANRSGGPDPDTADEVRRQLGGRIDLIVDGGACRLGVSSTVVDCTGGELRVLREGAVTPQQVREALARERRGAY
jgi:L-threonylcarbamoyladenylate synthase